MILVAFIGSARAWRLVWREQLVWLSDLLEKNDWRSAACLDGADALPSRAMASHLRIRGVLRRNVSENASGAAPARLSARWRALHTSGPHAVLHRLTSCSNFVLQQCAELGCVALVSTRPDLYFAPPTPPGGDGAVAALLRGTPRLQVHARVKCAAAGEDAGARIAHEQMDAMAAKWKARGVKLVEANYKLQKLPGPNGVVYMSE